MGYQGAATSRRRFEGAGVYPLSPGDVAGPELRAQAIQRTAREIQDPHGEWGIAGRTEDFSSGAGLLTIDVLAAEARVRLSQLRAMG